MAGGADGFARRLIVGAVVLSTIMGNPIAMKPLFVSKANTAVQIVLVLIVLGELAFTLNASFIRNAFIYLSALLTAASAAAYLVGWLRHMSGYGEGEISDG